MVKKIVIGILILVVGGFAGLWVVGQGGSGRHEGPGVPNEVQRPATEVARGEARQRAAASEIGASEKQILFGDLHVHTTISFDAFMLSLPVLQGEGAHPQSDACDFARYCSALDFWSINDHASAITPRAWQETVESIRQCNDVATDPANPDTVAFLGYEWTQVGTTPDNHWGHKNVVFAHTDDERIPTRAIAAGAVARLQREVAPGPIALGLLALTGRDDRYDDMALYFNERRAVPLCEEGVDTRDLPNDCQEIADTPGDLFRKLDEWGHDALVIPHGTSWGLYTPSASNWKKQLTQAMHDPDRQTLFEIYSGHGNSEEYRDWREVELGVDGTATCPKPREGYLPRCWRAGEIVRERCIADGAPASECDARAMETRQLAADAGGQAHLVVPGYDAAEWLDAGQCLDCKEPAFNYRPGGSAQYVMALSNFDEAEAPSEPLRFRFGFIASSDNHFARPGTGFKERGRIGNTESSNRPDDGNLIGRFIRPPPVERASTPTRFNRAETDLAGFQLFEMERQSSFFMTGGLVAVHAAGRDRGAIWSALERRETYGTSGPRMLLWFDLLNPPGSRGRSIPMGTATRMDDAPIFQVRAVGSFVQKPGCPDYATANLSVDALSHLCKNECYHPSDERRLITRIEVVRIRPQRSAEEAIAPLIEDPWRTFDCNPEPAGCAVTFSDPEFTEAARDTVYYVRAIEEPTQVINADGVRCEYDENGVCSSIRLCGASGTPTGTGTEDDCLGEAEPKAWSSPIFVDWLARNQRS